MSGQRKSPSHHNYDTSRLRSWCDPNGRTADKSWLLTGSVSALKRDVLNLSFGRKRKGKNWLDSEFMKFYQEKLGCKNKRAPTGIPIIIKKKKNKRWRGRGEIGPLVPCWWGRRIAQPPCSTGWWRFRKVRSELPRDPGIPLPVGGKRTERTSARNLRTDVRGP